MKQFRLLKVQYSLTRLYKDYIFTDDKKAEIEGLEVGDSVAYLPPGATRAYQIERIADYGIDNK